MGIGDTAYNKYEALPHLAYNCVKRLMDNNDTIWKLLYYTDPDAWKKPNLTREQKAALIYNGEEDEMKYNVFLDTGQPSVETEESTILRISPHGIFPENRTVGTVNMLFEVYSHYKINHLSNYTTRLDVITQQLIEVFNNSDIGGLGKLYFDKAASYGQDRMMQSGQQPFRGRWMLLSTKEA